MKKVALLILFIVMLFGIGIVSADPFNNPNAALLEINCDDGFSGEVLVPAFDSGPGGGPAGFFQGELGGIGRPRELTITVDGVVVEYWSQPGNGYESVGCSTQLGPTTFVELQIQRFNYKGN